MVTWEFIVTSLLIVIAPGPGTIYTISSGIRLGRTKSLVAAFGCTLGIIPHLAIGIFGVALFSRIDPILLMIVQLLGALYLVYLGYKMFKFNTSLQLDNDNMNGKSSSIIVQAILINLLNPKLTLFFLSFLPQFISQNETNVIAQTVILGIIFMVLTIIVFSIYGLLAGTFNRVIEEYPKRMVLVQKIIGVVFFGFAIKIIVDLII